MALCIVFMFVAVLFKLNFEPKKAQFMLHMAELSVIGVALYPLWSLGVWLRKLLYQRKQNQ